ATGRPLNHIFDAADEKSGTPMDDLSRQSIQAGEAVRSAEGLNLLTAKDGSLVPIEAGAAHMRDINNRIIGVVVVFRDITVRKRTEKRLRLLSEALEQPTKGLPWWT
ncbi:PAS domain S-box protein, partial [Thermodesulfobacteriota bacterium]